MKMTVFLLVSVVVLLAGPAAKTPAVAISIFKRHAKSENLNNILDEINNYTKSLTQDAFVEDVDDLAAPKCENKFFCKVHHILHEHHKSHNHNSHAELIMRNLKQFFSASKINCEELLKEVKSTDVKKQIVDVMDHLKKCIQHRNTKGTSTK